MNCVRIEPPKMYATLRGDVTTVQRLCIVVFTVGITLWRSFGTRSTTPTPSTQARMISRTPRMLPLSVPPSPTSLSENPPVAAPAVSRITTTWTTV